MSAQNSRSKINPNTGVFDFTDIVNEFNTGKDFPPNGKYAPQHFFRGALVGPSGCGKTSCLLSMILAPDRDTHIGYDKLYIFAKDIHEPAYEMLRKVLERVEEEIRRNEKKDASWNLFVMSDSLKDVPEVKNLDKKIRNLAIFDDWATEPDKDQAIICQYYKMARKHNCSMFYLSQGYSEIPRFIRKQLTHLFLWRLRNKRDIGYVLKEQNPGYEDEVFEKMYMAATEPKYSFVLIDKLNPDKPIRQGFKNFPQFSGDSARGGSSGEESSDGEY
jgi:hypothetical protein